MPNAKEKEVALRKRQQIDSSKKSMFITVAIVGFISGIALVATYFLAQQIWFNGRIINEKQNTLNTIRANAAAVEDLKDNIRVLDTNDALNSVRLNDDASALQSILDALPAAPNSDALGASLQERFINPIDGIRLESLRVDTIEIGEGDEVAEDTSEAADGDASEGAEVELPSIGFSFSVNGSPDGLKQLLTRFERSIRVIDIVSIDIKAEGNGLTMDVVGRAFYDPARTIEIGTKVVKP